MSALSTTSPVLAAMEKAVHTGVMTITLGIEESAVYQVEPGFPLANLEAQNEFTAGKDRMDIAVAVTRTSTASTSLSAETARSEPAKWPSHSTEVRLCRAANI